MGTVITLRFLITVKHPCESAQLLCYVLNTQNVTQLLRGFTRVVYKFHPILCFDPLFLYQYLNLLVKILSVLISFFTNEITLYSLSTYSMGIQLVHSGDYKMQSHICKSKLFNLKIQ